MSQSMEDWRAWTLEYDVPSRAPWSQDHALFVNKRKTVLQQDNYHQLILTTHQQPTTYSLPKQ
jgi:hypothetical protein